MIAIDNILVSDELIDEQFVCDLTKCKGGCCVDGDAGAPLTLDELDNINEVYDAVLPYLPAESRAELAKQGRYVYDKEFGWVTPTIKGKICVYGITDANGVVKCGIEQAYNDGKVQWKKPISCHLFPIRISKSKNGLTEFVNYEPRQDLCKAACKLGTKLKVPVYVFLKDAIIRKYGNSFYEALQATAQHINQVKK
ncbi:MAG: hypothetical protein RL172_641 [Bacteroidota bacterium]|jgi:hypothetical protein